MKILYINKYFWHKGGAETVFFQDREAAIEKGYNVIDFSMKHSRNIDSEQKDFFIKNIEYYESEDGQLTRSAKARLLINFIRNNEALSNLRKLISKEKPDLAHLHNIYHQLTPAIIPILKNAGVKVVLTLHDYKLICPNYLMLNKGNICDKCLGGKFYNAAFQKCKDGSIIKGIMLSLEAYWHQWARSYEKADVILAPSNFLANLVKKYRKNIHRVRVLKNGVDIDSLNYSTIDKNYAIYFGRISREKGVETLLRAYSIITDRSNNNKNNVFGLKIVGEGDQLSDLKERYPNIEFLGYKSGADLIKLVSESSFAVVPSEWYENCSMTVLEAMAYGKAIVGTKIGGIPEQIDDGKNGLLFEMADTGQLTDKMNVLIDNPELRSEMGKNARKKVEQEYSISKHKEHLFELYEEMMRDI